MEKAAHVGAELRRVIAINGLLPTPKAGLVRGSKLIPPISASVWMLLRAALQRREGRPELRSQ